MFLGNDVLAQVFSCECYELSKNTFFTEHLRTTASAFLGLFYVHKVVSLSVTIFFLPEWFWKTKPKEAKLYLKRDSGTGVFLCTLRNFNEHLFYQTLPVAASDEQTS